MSTDAGGLRALLERWYEHGDEAACCDLVRGLIRAMHPHSGAVSQLGAGRVEELMQDTIIRLLDREARRMQDAEHPAAFARKALKHSLLSELRKRQRRRELFEPHREHELATSPYQTSADIERVDLKLDTERAMALAQRLSYDQRVLLMLLLMPSTITPGEWERLCERHPPPPPARPCGPVDEEEARRLLMPIDEDSADALRRQKDRFRVVRRRAVDALRFMLEEE